MSTTAPQSDVESIEYTCGHCGGAHTPAETVAGSFCSTGCHRGHQRAKRAGEFFRELEQDHRFCATCGRQLKTTNKPPRQVVIPPSLHDADWGNASDVLVGYQYRTPHAETGEISLDVDDDADRPIVEDGVAKGTVCCCGNTDHRHEEPAIRERFPFTTAYWLLVAARTLRAEDKHDIDFDQGQLLDAVLDGDTIREAATEAVVLDD